MRGFLVRRLLGLVGVLLGVAVVTFCLILLIPGDPVDAMIPGASAEAKAQYRNELHLNDGVVPRFVAWLGHAVSGDFGRSIQQGRSAADVALTALGNTAQLAAVALVLAVAGGVGAGALMAWWSGSWRGRLVNWLVVGGASMPQFWLGLVLLWIFSLELGLLPASGMSPIAGDGGPVERLQYIVLPAITVAMLPMALIGRLSRTLFLETMGQEFVVVLRARRYSGTRILRHVTRNAAAGVVNITGLQAGYLLLGTLFAEVVFNWPGLGMQIVTSIESRDYPVIQAIVLFSGIVFASITVLSDVLMRLLDPRLEA